MPRSRLVAGALVAAPLLALLASCASTGGEAADAPGAPTAAVDTRATHAAGASDVAHGELLPNLRRLDDGLLSGGLPAGDAAFAELAAMGVKTIISVDGMTPDVQGAAAHGLRYVHIPITYAEVTLAEQLELARAIRDLPGPVYVHCHHGKHRSPAAAAAAAVALGLITPAQGVAYMKDAGTAPNYEGLYACVSVARTATPAQLDAAPAGFPAVRQADGIVAAMVEVDAAFEHLSAIKGAGWQVPADHPDLVPAAEAGRLTDNLRLSGEDPGVADLGDDFARRLADAVARASALEEAIVGGAPASELDARFTLARTSCKDCHATYRDRR